MNSKHFLNTLDYGILPVVTSSEWLTSDILREATIEDCNGNYYELRKTLNGSLVLKVENVCSQIYEREITTFELQSFIYDNNTKINQFELAAMKREELLKIYNEMRREHDK